MQACCVNVIHMFLKILSGADGPVWIPMKLEFYCCICDLNWDGITS